MNCNAMGKTLLIGVLGTSLLLGGCAKEVAPPPMEEASSVPVVSEEVPVEPVQTMEDKNPLTGQVIDESLRGKRPTSFIINNSHEAWPQAGLTAADVVYEWPYEGGATRLMAVTMDYTETEKFGPLRSARHDFVELSLPLHTVFVHWGGSKPGYASIREHELNNVDGMSSISCFFRDQTRLDAGKALEHTAMVDTAELKKAIDKRKFNLDMAIDPMFNFDLSGEDLIFTDTEAYELGLDVCDEVYCTFEYDEASKTYAKYEYDEQQMDANNDQPVAVDNVFVLYANITQYDGTNVWRDIHLDEGGAGYYVTRGTKTPIQWSKNDAYAPMVYQTADGQDLTVNPGKSWVMICDQDTETVWKGNGTDVEAATSDLEDLSEE